VVKFGIGTTAERILSNHQYMILTLEDVEYVYAIQFQLGASHRIPYNNERMNSVLQLQVHY